MKKIGFITSPLNSGHASRGVGFYTKHILNELKIQSSKFDMEIHEISNLRFRTSNYDLIHYPFFDPFNHTLPIIKKNKTVVTIHDVIPLEFPDHYPPGFKGNINLILQKLSLSNVDRIITDSLASVNSIHKYLGVPLNKLKLVYLAVASQYKPIKNKQVLLRVKNKYTLPDKFILYVGDFNWNKNIPGLISAAKKIGIPLVWVGKHALEIESLDLSHSELAHLKDLDLGPTHRLGFVPDDDLAAIYNLASVYCQPSFAEGFGLPVLEALACGTPVACSNTHSLPEVATNNADYFDPHNIDQVVTAIKTALSRERHAPELPFSWEKSAVNTLQVYKDVL
jgi:glycosyltransferase involved in cell wall biosynthesis